MKRKIDYSRISIEKNGEKKRLIAGIENGCKKEGSSKNENTKKTDQITWRARRRDHSRKASSSRNVRKRDDSVH